MFVLAETLFPKKSIALQDDVLTWREARVILEAAGEKLGAKE
jgi:hypothetical protein